MIAAPPSELRVRWQISLSRFGSAPERRMEPAYACHVNPSGDERNRRTGSSSQRPLGLSSRAALTLGISRQLRGRRRRPISDDFELAVGLAASAREVIARSAAV